MTATLFIKNEKKEVEVYRFNTTNPKFSQYNGDICVARKLQNNTAFIKLLANDVTLTTGPIVGVVYSDGLSSKKIITESGSVYELVKL